MLKIAIIVGSTRPGRVASSVADWIYTIASKRTGVEFEVVEIENFALPLLDEPVPAAMGTYMKEHTRQWAAKIASFDAYVFVAPEYNHSIPAALKNALDFVYAEWGNKSAGIVSYGGSLGARSIEHLRGILGALQIADVCTSVGLSIYDDFENFSVFKPRSQNNASVDKMLDQVVGWGEALKSYRDKLDKA